MKQLILALLWIVLLAACAPAAITGNPATPQPILVVTTDTPVPPAGETSSPADMTRLDEQGAVVIQVTPLNLGLASDTLDFEVAMNTHSVDLSMDLAALATLTTDTGMTIQATQWEAMRGGHHVGGKLIFPSTLDGKSILEGAGKLTLTIVNVDAPSRIFEWQLNYSG